MPAVELIALTATLLLLHEVLRRAGLWLALGLYLALPVALTAYWVGANNFDLFLWFKLYTIVFCACYGTVLRYTHLADSPRARAAVAALVALNVLEAVALDLSSGGLGHALNAVAGLALVVVLPWGASAARLRVNGGCRDGCYRVSRRWVVGYAVWNATFVYLNYPELGGHHIAVLAAATLVGVRDPRLWLQAARRYTLAADFIVLATFYPTVLSSLGTAHRADPVAGAVAAGAALLVAVWGARERWPAAACWSGECLTRARAAGQ